MALTLSYVLLAFLTLLLLSWGSGILKSQVVLVTVGEPVSMECPFHKYNGTSNPFYEILWSHRNDLRRVLQFRMTRSNQSCVYDSKGRFSGALDFGSSVSFLNISTVLMNDTGPYFCYVKIGNSDPTTKMIFLLVRGQQPWAAPGDLSYSALQGSKVTLDCDFPTNLTGNFTDLFWLHKRDQSPSRLIAWHLRSSFQVENGSIGSRFQSSLDLENDRSRLTITGLEEEDSGWYQCQRGLGEPSGGQRGRGTNLTVKDRCYVQLKRQNTLADGLHPHCGPSETMGRETTSREAIYVSTGSTEYSLLTFPGRNPAAGDVGQR
ncbi:polymeric immunoglobulin receptor-like isoform X2 [Centrocercus urophasianus]|uniref:polymeric immunoglobulin receptor-like isoform X2 n=1 Tax=Centrocercus urophasianus TaxID=9002 RepID=UPI001C644FFD|nr:polymeric immunoglobulin receptor-like isoform X2 [Centrocercus urophasianus]